MVLEYNYKYKKQITESYSMIPFPYSYKTKLNNALFRDIKLLKKGRWQAQSSGSRYSQVENKGIGQVNKI